ncbi:MAG: hypothetical protein Ta2A_19120 [Treponemataceae bacterium]|nr:MAG: hypothetical protein Ta2A_19120 [Treponemataceae bacterium]
MIYFFDDFESLAKEHNTEKAMDILTEQNRNKVLSFTHTEQKLLSLAGRLLLQKVIGKQPLDFSDTGKPTIAATETAKQLGAAGVPAAAEPQTFFNISHCKMCAVLIVAHSECGIDIESVDRKIGQAVYEKIFDAATMPKTPAEAIAFWTLKESFAKATGAGLSADFRKITKDTIAQCGYFCKTAIHKTPCAEYVFSYCVKTAEIADETVATTDSFAVAKTDGFCVEQKYVTLSVEDLLAITGTMDDAQ